MRPQATDRGTGQVKSKQQIVGERERERGKGERKKERNLFTFIKPRSETIKTENKMDKNETPTLNFGQVVQGEWVKGGQKGQPGKQRKSKNKCLRLQLRLQLRRATPTTASPLPSPTWTHKKTFVKANSEWS